MNATTNKRQNITQLLQGVKKPLLFYDDICYTDKTGNKLRGVL